MVYKYYAMGVIALLVVAAGSAAVWKYNSAIETVVALESKIETLDKNLKEKDTKLAELTLQVQEVEKKRKTHEAQVLSLNNQIAKTSRDLLALKNREKTVVAKPGLVELKINKAFVKQQKVYACITGDTTACE